MARSMLLLSLALCAISSTVVNSIEVSNKINSTTDGEETAPKVSFGYRLPGNLFNDGKPFYVEKDPLTGAFDFESKTSPTYDANKDKTQQYLSDAPVERTDTDSNEVTFYDFLNLPVKYTSSKYVYPLISSSYANTKLQGNGNNINNHKLDPGTVVRTTTQRPNYYNHRTATTTPGYIKNIMTTTPKPTTTRATTVSTTPRPKPSTSEQPIMSLLEHLFGSYDEMTTDKTDEEYSDNDLLQSGSEAHAQITTTTTYTPPVRTTAKLMTTEPTTTSTTARTTTRSTTLVTRPTSVVRPVTTARPMPTNRPTSTIRPIPSVRPVSTLGPSTVRPIPSVRPASASPIPTSRPILSSSSQPISAPVSTQRPTFSVSTTRAPLMHQYQLVTSMPLDEYEIRDVQPTKPQLMYEQPASNDQYVQMHMHNSMKSNGHGGQVYASNNVIIPPGQNSVSFIVRNQQSVDGGQFIGSTAKESPYVDRQNQPHHMQLHGDMVVSTQDNVRLPVTNTAPVREGQIYPAKTENDNEIQSKVVFPNPSTNLVREPPPAKPMPIVNDDIDLVPPPPTEPLYSAQNSGHGGQKEILQLTGQPLYHQIPKDLTSTEKLHRRPDGSGNFRPPWDPRPGHFQMGKPEFSRPLRTGAPPNIASRISEAYPLPNILPQFRPNSRTSYVDYWEDRHPGQHVHYPPRHPIGFHGRPYHDFYDKVSRPVAPHGEQIERGSNKRVRPDASITPYDPSNVSPPDANRRHSTYRNDDPPMKVRGSHPFFYERMYDTTVHNPSMALKETVSKTADEYALLKAPPVVPISVTGQEVKTPDTVVTLQMIQSKQMAKDNMDSNYKSDISPKFNLGENKIPAEEKRQVYVVYPVNSAPVKLDVIQPNNKVGMVIASHGSTRPVASPEIRKEDNDYTNTPFTITHEEQKPLLVVRQKGEVQKMTNKIKSSFPYPLEYPVADTALAEETIPTEQNTVYPSNKQVTRFDEENDLWSVGKGPTKFSSEVLKADRFDLLPAEESSEKPIAIAYTATGRPELKVTLSGEPGINKMVHPVPSYTSADNSGGSEFTVSAVMHTLARAPQQGTVLDVTPDQEFRAPFQASENVGSRPAQGWTAVANKKVDSNSDQPEQDEEVTTDSQFAFEHFKPQLFGGFKPIYKLPTPSQNLSEEVTTQSNGRLERNVPL